MREFADGFAAYLKEKGIAAFRREELEDAHHSTVFRTSLSVRGQQVPVGVIFDDTMYVIVRANMASHAVNDANAYEVNHFIARMNYGNKLFKYYLTPDTSVILDACVPMLPDGFSPRLVQTIVQVVMKEAAARHRELMKLIWQEDG